MSWEFIKLKDIASTSSGGTPNRSKKQFWDNGNIPWIKSGQLKDCIVTNAEEFISEEGLRSSSAKYFKKGTLLLAMYGATAGKLGFLGLDATTNQAICSIIPKSDNLDSKFLYYFLLSIRKEIISDSAGGAQPNIGQNYINELQIPLPPLETQKRIADILDAADALRQKDQELLKKYDELAQAIFIDMFGDPVRNEKGWDVKKLSKISTKIHSGNTPKGGSNVYFKSGIIFFRSQNVWKNNLIYNDIAYIDKKTHSSMSKSSLEFKDILMTKTGRINTENSSLGRAALFLGENYSANINGHVYLIRLKRDQIHEFVIDILTSKQYRDLIREVCVGGIDKRQLNKDHIEDFPIICPPIDMQIKYAELNNLIGQQRNKGEINALNSENIFNSLLQKAFNGELVE